MAQGPAGDRKVTIKQIAERFGVSVSTVYKALAGRPGVSDEMRRKISAYADEAGYRRNEAASMLRRSSLVVAACVPETSGDGRFFWADIWEGLRAGARQEAVAGIRLDEVPYSAGDQTEALLGVERSFGAGGRLDGVVSVPPASDEAADALRRLSAAGVPCVLVTGDVPTCGRLGSVGADYEMAGALMAEQAANFLGGSGSVLLLVGDPYIDSHYLVARAFHQALRRGGWDFRVEDLAGYADRARLRADLYRRFDEASEEKGAPVGRPANPLPDLVCSVFATGNPILAEVFHGRGLAGKIPVIANDVFSANMRLLREGTFSNLVFKNPQLQGRLALKMLVDKLLRAKDPDPAVVKVGAELVFRANLSRYARLTVAG